MNNLIYWDYIFNKYQVNDAPLQEIWPPILENFLKKMNVVLQTFKKKGVKKTSKKVSGLTGID